MHHSFEFYPDAIDMIDYLKKKQVKLAVVSEASVERLWKTASAQFLDQFYSVITGDHVIASKPSPEPYIQASKELLNSPAGQLVIEMLL